jgi:hypothetical protein
MYYILHLSSQQSTYSNSRIGLFGSRGSVASIDNAILNASIRRYLAHRRSTRNSGWHDYGSPGFCERCVEACGTMIRRGLWFALSEARRKGCYTIAVIHSTPNLILTSVLCLGRTVSCVTRPMRCLSCFYSLRIPHHVADMGHFRPFDYQRARTAGIV